MDGRVRLRGWGTDSEYRVRPGRLGTDLCQHIGCRLQPPLGSLRANRLLVWSGTEPPSLVTRTAVFQQVDPAGSTPAGMSGDIG